MSGDTDQWHEHDVVKLRAQATLEWGKKDVYVSEESGVVGLNFQQSKEISMQDQSNGHYDVNGKSKAQPTTDSDDCSGCCQLTTRGKTRALLQKIFLRMWRNVGIVFFLAVALTSSVLIIERMDGLLDRSWVAGVTPLEIFFSHVITQFVVMVGQTALVLIFMIAVFRVECKGNLILVVILTILQGLCGMCFEEGKMRPLFAASFLLVTVTLFRSTKAHGRLIEPPSRASMWRYGFQDSPPDYNDHELYCGGFSRQWNKNGGKCGICGDAWDSPQPRAHEAGGKYGQGVIVRKLKSGSTMLIRVELTANHRGYFEFRLCPNNNVKKVATQACLDTHVLKRARMTAKDSGAPDEMFHPTRFYPGTENKVYEMRYVLPKGLSCTQCVLQWRYIAGNNWGKCENGTEAVGCGPQEEFRACSDIAIIDSRGTADDTPFTDTNEETDDTINEIDSNGEREEITIQHQTSSHFLLLGSIVLFGLVSVLLVFLIIYLYYYHAKEIIKDWWNDRSKNFSISTVKKFSCWEYFSKQKVSATSEKQYQSEPMPPPRIKRTATIGFKGVPDNLV